MISSLAGTALHISLDSIVVEVGGVGLSVQCNPDVSREARIGDPIRLSTSLVVREDSLTLFGFLEADQRDVFEKVQTVSGVGPRVALAMLSVLNPDQLRAAVQNKEETMLTRVPGIGKKGAQRIVLELTDKLGPPRTNSSVDVRQTNVGPAQPWQSPVREALMSLGWSAREAEDAVDVVTAENTDQASASDDQTVSKMLALALRGMSRR